MSFSTVPNNPENSELTLIINEMWSALDKSAKHYCENDEKLIFHHDRFDLFSTYFTSLYTSIKDRYMAPEVKELDRHKVAAVMIVSSIKANAITLDDKLSRKYKFLGLEMIATEVAMAWMLSGLQRKIQDVELPDIIEGYSMPTAFACDTSYFDIFCRNLYYAKENNVLNPLDIAEKLFLLEYITLLENNIDPTTLHYN